LPELWSRNPGFAVVESPGRVGVLDLGEVTAARPLVMEGPAAAIWSALETPGTTVQVVERVAHDFGLPAAEVADDVRGFLDDLCARGLVRDTASSET
jgi:hypothetical protein